MPGFHPEFQRNIFLIYYSHGDTLIGPPCVSQYVLNKSKTLKH